MFYWFELDVLLVQTRCSIGSNYIYYWFELDVLLVRRTNKAGSNYMLYYFLVFKRVTKKSPLLKRSDCSCFLLIVQLLCRHYWWICYRVSFTSSKTRLEFIHNTVSAQYTSIGSSAKGFVE
jgi:hypothetical protein